MMFSGLAAFDSFELGLAMSVGGAVLSRSWFTLGNGNCQVGIEDDVTHLSLTVGPWLDVLPEGTTEC
eukprot:4483123-Amphidinium_carterae.1